MQKESAHKIFEVSDFLVHHGVHVLERIALLRKVLVQCVQFVNFLVC